MTTTVSALMGPGFTGTVEALTIACDEFTTSAFAKGPVPRADFPVGSCDFSCQTVPDGVIAVDLLVTVIAKDERRNILSEELVTSVIEDGLRRFYGPEVSIKVVVLIDLRRGSYGHDAPYYKPDVSPEATLERVRRRVAGDHSKVNFVRA